MKGTKLKIFTHSHCTRGQSLPIISVNTDWKKNTHIQCAFKGCNNKYTTFSIYNSLFPPANMSHSHSHTLSKKSQPHTNTPVTTGFFFSIVFFPALQIWHMHINFQSWNLKAERKKKYIWICTYKVNCANVYRLCSCMG